MYEEIAALLLAILQGAFSGFWVALAGYFAKGVPEGEKPDIKKAAPALIIGIIAGVMAQLQGIELVAASDYLAMIGVTSMVNYIWMTLVKLRSNQETTGAWIKKAK